MTLLEQLYALEQTEPENRNIITAYLPFRNKGNSFDYSAVAGSVLAILLGKQLQHFDSAHFKARCLAAVGQRLTDEAFLPHIEQMYFGNDALFRVSPEFLLLGHQQQETTASKHLSHIFQSFMVQRPQYKQLENKANFIEHLFLDILREHLRERKAAADTAPYLPFVASYFVQDLDFFTHQTDYMLQELENFLEPVQLPLPVPSSP
jgi:DNA phosphorothioation-dependent restriction protein DptG